MQKISKTMARNMILNAGSQAFTVRFTKRTTGELRVINARLGVYKNLTGKGMAFSPREKKLIPVFELNRNQYRMIPVEGINELRISGNRFQVV